MEDGAVGKKLTANGSIVELGTHAELMEQKGLYARLCSLQFRDPVEELAAMRAGYSPNGHTSEEKRAVEKPAGLFGAILGGSAR